MVSLPRLRWHTQKHRIPAASAALRYALCIMYDISRSAAVSELARRTLYSLVPLRAPRVQAHP